MRDLRRLIYCNVLDNLPPAGEVGEPDPAESSVFSRQIKGESTFIPQVPSSPNYATLRSCLFSVLSQVKVDDFFLDIFDKFLLNKLCRNPIQFFSLQF